MGSIDRLPPALRNRGAVVSMASQLDRSRNEASKLRAAAKEPPSIIAVAIPSIGGAFGAGYMDATFPDFAGGRTQPSVAAGLITVTASYFMESEMGVYAGVGMLNNQGYAAGVKAAGYDLAIIEQTDGGTE